MTGVCAMGFVSWSFRQLVFSSVGLGAVGDGLAQVVQLLAARRAQLLQDGELLARLGHVARDYIELAQILPGALVVGIEVERLAIVGERRFVIPGLAQAEGVQVVGIGVVEA